MSSAGSPRLDDCGFAVVDVETTGGVLRSDRITEIAVIAVQQGRIETAFQSLVNPARPIPRAVSAVTRITDDMVRGQPLFSEIADPLFAALAGRVFVAHNAGFDWRFVSLELKRARGMVLDGPRICTVKLARRLVPGLKSRSLDSLAPSGRHAGFETRLDQVKHEEGQRIEHYRDQGTSQDQVLSLGRHDGSCVGTADSPDHVAAVGVVRRHGRLARFAAA